MKRSLMTMCLGALLVGAVALPLSAGDKEPTKPASGSQPAGMPQMSPELAQAMQRMEAYGAINENHAYLKQFEGEWQYTSKWWMEPNAKPVENTITSTAKIAYDGHFLVEKVQGKMSMGEYLTVVFTSYFVKLGVAILVTPLIYALHQVIEKRYGIEPAPPEVESAEISKS